MSELRTPTQRKADILAALDGNSDAWLATAGRSGRPHLIAVSAWWHDGLLTIATRATTQTARNLDTTRVGRVALGSPADVVMIDAELDGAVAVADAPAALSGGFSAGVGWDPAEEGPDWRFFTLRPTRIQAYRGYGELEGRDVMKDGRWLACDPSRAPGTHRAHASPAGLSRATLAVAARAACEVGVGRAIAIRHVGFEDLGILEPLLRGRGLEPEYRDAGVDALDPDELAAADLLVILGAPIGAADVEHYPFLATEIEAARARMIRPVPAPTLGICLGAQIMALAAGVEVKPTGRKEIGFAPLTLTGAGGRSVLAALGDTPVLHWHGDAFDIPEGAERLAETPGFPNQAFSLGPNLLGLQFHLEVDHSKLERWLVGHALELELAGIDPRTLRADAARSGPSLGQAGARVFGRWLDGLSR
jgi:GMP synthase (glutamine-hydrolysing)